MVRNFHGGARHRARGIDVRPSKAGLSGAKKCPDPSLARYIPYVLMHNDILRHDVTAEKIVNLIFFHM